MLRWTRMLAVTLLLLAVAGCNLEVKGQASVSAGGCTARVTINTGGAARARSLP